MTASCQTKTPYGNLINVGRDSTLLFKRVQCENLHPSTHAGLIAFEHSGASVREGVWP